MEQNFEKLIKIISKDYLDNKFMNYIKYIQFPKYKNLTENSKIEFEFPLTMLVGKNGTGKSSVLQAIYGCPQNKSTGDYWFSTDVDPIEDGRNKYFYGYQKDCETRIKEVIKKRQPSVKSPDYWETDALDVKVGMKKDNNMDNETRNNPVEKNVVYFDFRGELSAYDKYFHFYKSKPDRKVRMFEQKNKESKEYIKKQSKLLNRAFKGEKVAYFNHPENVLHVYYQEAFYNIKEEMDRKNLILCEDASAQTFIKKLLIHLKIDDYFSVEYRHGGAETLVTKHLPILALDEMYDKVFIILDGDKKPDKLVEYSEIPAGEIEDVECLEKYIRGLTSSNAIINALVDGGKNGAVESQKIDVYKKYLKYAETHLYYLPGNCIPEAIVLQLDGIDDIYGDRILKPIDNINAKRSVGNICQTIFSEDNCRNSTMVMLTKQWIEAGGKAKYYDEMCNMLKEIYNYCNCK